MKYVSSPFREYAIISGVSVLLGGNFLFPQIGSILLVAALLGSLSTFWNALRSLAKFRIGIDVFNAFALAVAFGAGETRSAAFIVLMLAFAGLLDWHTAARAHKAVEELLKLKPLTALREKAGDIKEVSITKIKEGDIVVVENGARVPVDGVIVYGSAFLNESSVTGESRPIERGVGDNAVSSAFVESGIIKIKATRVGEDSTIERIAGLIKKASTHKSRSEKLADKFAGVFLPVVLAGGILLYIITKNITMTAAFFLVACADDVAVAIPLAMTAALGRAAKRGIIIKGGEWFDALSNMKTVVVDKTGTLTYGSIAVRAVHIEKGIDADEFWRFAAAAEKFSEHPIGKALYKEARAYTGGTDDPSEFKAYKGSGIWARVESREIIIGSAKLFAHFAIEMPSAFKEQGGTSVFAAIDKKFAGMFSVSDTPRKEAKKSIKALKRLGVANIIMFTGDNEETARRIAYALGIDHYRASMSPEDKLREVEKLCKKEIVAMVGDGINDTPALARANVGIAMGKAGTAIAVEAADIVILNDDLSRIPEAVKLSRRVLSVVKGDIVIWVFSNVIGFTLVLSGIAGPALAAFYNFITDFFPILNSARLFHGTFDK